MQAEKQIRSRVLFNPSGVTRHFASDPLQVVAIQIQAFGIYPTAGGETGRIEHRANQPVHIGQLRATEQSRDRQRSGRFVAMNAR